jgi:hypothetical protein
MKWLALATALVAAALFLLWREVRSPGSTAAVADVQVAAPAAPVMRASPNLGEPEPEHLARILDDRALAPDVRPAGVMAPEDYAEPVKKYSEQFWERVDETYARKLLGHAAECYAGGKDRKQKLKVAYRYRIAGGTVTIGDVRMVESTLGDPALEACMLKEIAAATWDDQHMPDWSSSAEEEETLVVRISTLKRFGPESD